MPVTHIPTDPLGQLTGYIMWMMLHGPGDPPVPLTRSQAIARAMQDERFADFSRAEFTRAGQIANQNVSLTRYATAHPDTPFVDCLTAEDTVVRTFGARVWYEYVDENGVPRHGSVLVNASGAVTVNRLTNAVRGWIRRGELARADSPLYGEARITAMGISAVYCGGYSNPYATI